MTRSIPGKEKITVYLAIKQIKHVRKQANQSAYIEALVAADMQDPTLEQRVTALENGYAIIKKPPTVQYSSTAKGVNDFKTIAVGGPGGCGIASYVDSDQLSIEDDNHVPVTDCQDQEQLCRIAECSEDGAHWINCYRNKP